MKLTLDEIFQRTGTTKYTAPPQYEAGDNTGYILRFRREWITQPPGIETGEYGEPRYRGAALTRDIYSGIWKTANGDSVPEEVSLYLTGTDGSAANQGAIQAGRLYAYTADYVPDWAAAVKAADNGGGWVEMAVKVGMSAMVAHAAWDIAGSLSTDGFSLGAEATEEFTVSMTETQGVSTVGETGMEWYSVDPGPDPFATTADVNAGWSFDGGYAGVDWYNSAGVGEINAADSSLWDIFGKATTAVKQGLGAVVAASGALQATRNNLAQPQPNYTRAAGGINVGLLAVGLLAWKLL